MTAPKLSAIGFSARLGIVAALALILAPLSASAQVQAVDPDKAIDGDLASAPARAVDTPPAAAPATTVTTGQAAQAIPAANAPTTTTPSGSSLPVQTGGTYHQDDLVGAAEGVFGKGAHGLADVIQDILKKQGEPNGYIVGREGGGAIIVGLRYGSGTLYHKVEGQMPVYWTGPSVGFDAGANAGNTFVLVYNLYNSADLYHRYGAGEGQAYLLGGFNVSYLRRKDVVLIPVRVGVGLRLGINAGYMKISHRQNWFPF